jgi:DoxX-like family
MNLALWIVAGLLAVVFLVGGAAKLLVPKKKLADFPGGGWVDDFSAGAVKALGAIDVLAAVGLILPAALDIVPALVPVAAVGVMLLMIGAVITRLHVHSARTIVPDLAYLALAAFVAWGRFGPESF